MTSMSHGGFQRLRGWRLNVTGEGFAPPKGQGSPRGMRKQKEPMESGRISSRPKIRSFGPPNFGSFLEGKWDPGDFRKIQVGEIL